MSSTQYPGTAQLGAVIPFPPRAEARDVASLEALRRFEFAIGTLERLMDFLAAMAAVVTAHWIDALWLGGATAQYPKDAVLTAAAGFAVIIVLLLEKYGDYRPCLSLLAVRETERLMRVTIAGFLLALPIVVGVTRAIPRRAIALTLVMAPLLLALEKWQVQRVIRVARRWLGATRKAAIVGVGPLARRIFSTLVHSAKLGIEPVAFVGAAAEVGEPAIYESSYQRKQQATVLAEPVTPRLLRKLGASVLIIAEPEMPAEEAIGIRREAEAAGISTYVSPEPFFDAGGATDYVELDGVLLAHQPRGGPRRMYQATKRALDVGLSVVALLAVSPLLIAAALAVKLTSEGPVLFRQQRVGQHGQVFIMYKFRTMHTACAKYARSPVSGSDPRITRVGRILRHLCIDELPQLINVLRGEMSLVGPRPEMRFIVEQYEAIHRKRLTVKPGITGLWQLSADRMSPIHKNIGYDLYYVQHGSVLMDVAIMLHTLVFAFRGV